MHADAARGDTRDSFDALLQAAVCPSEATDTDPLEPARFDRLAIGMKVSERFLVEWFAGAGGMGDVYRCQDTKTQRTVALKVIRRLDDQGRFKREAAILSTLSHPTIVRYVAHGDTDAGTPYLAMEWLEGEDLGKRLSRGRLPIGDCIAIARRMCEGLSLAHGHGFIHRDIKPSNVFLVGGRVDEAKLLDFGIAHRGAATQTATRAGTVLGTVGYMAPEQASGVRLPDPRADLFSLGCVLFECLTARPAFAGESSVAVLESVLRADAPDVRTIRPEVPAELAGLLTRLLSKDRKARPADGAAVLRILESLEAARSGVRARSRRGEHALWQLTPAPSTARISVRLFSGTSSAALVQAELDSLAHALGASSTGTGPAAYYLELATVREATLTDLAARAVEGALTLLDAQPDLTLSVRTRLAGAMVGAEDEPSLGSDAHASPIRIDDTTAALCFMRAEQEAAAFPASVALAPSQAPRLPPPFAGRDMELAVLEAVLDECVSDSVARTVLACAPAGLGRTRLASEFIEHVAVQGRARVLCLRPQWSERATPHSLVRALMRAAGQEQAALHAMEDPRGFELFLTSLAATPLVVCIDDAQWADVASMQLLGAALVACAELPLLVLGLTRPELSSELRAVWQATGAHDLHVRPLKARAAERLYRTAVSARAEPSSDELALAIELGGGSPRLLCAMARARLEGGEAFALAVALYGERLAELSPSELGTLAGASVFGHTAWSSGISAVLEGSPGVERDLAALSERRLLVQQPYSRYASELEYTFTHELVRESAYRMLRREDRASAGRRARRWIARMEGAGANLPLLRRPS